jgi:uncharacterized protein YciI
MASYLLTYSYVPDIENRRQPYREAHLEHLRRAHLSGMLRMAGALVDPVDGALLVLEAGSPGEVFAWVARDPYNEAGLLRALSVREWTIAIGG